MNGLDSTSRRSYSIFESLESRRLLSAALQPPSMIALTPVLPTPISPAPITTTPLLRGAAIHAEAGEAFTAVIGTINNMRVTAVDSSFKGTIDWGDGTATTEAKFVAQGNGAIAIEGTHMYAGTGTDAISIVVTRSGPPGSLAPIILVGKISSQAFVISSPGGVTLTESAHASFTGAVGTFSSDLSSLNMKATIRWGDGYTSVGRIVAIPNAGPAAGGEFEVFGTHTYQTTGSYVVNVTVTSSPSMTSPQPTPQFIIMVAQIQSVIDVLPGLSVVPLA